MRPQKMGLQSIPSRRLASEKYCLMYDLLSRGLSCDWISDNHDSENGDHEVAVQKAADSGTHQFTVNPLSKSLSTIKIH